MERIERAREWLKGKNPKLVSTQTGLTVYWVKQFASGRVLRPMADNFLRLEEYIDGQNGYSCSGGVSGGVHGHVFARYESARN